MNTKSLLFKDKVLIFAILFSAVWHLFWLSALTVVVVPKDTKPPKFSSVSFLGPILDESVLAVSAVRHERSVLEKRYLSSIENSSVLIGQKAGPNGYTEADEHANQAADSHADCRSHRNADGRAGRGGGD